jgi:4'-phosphopantetheinyl transferase
VNSLSLFGAPPSCFKLTVGEVHIWSVYLDQSDPIIAALTRILSDEEKKRAVRFLFPIDRKRFIVCRGILKMILGHYLKIDPNQLYFAYSSNGKPLISNSINSQNLRFNLSHSDSLALYAFTLCHEIGIDVEKIIRTPEMDQVAKRYFSENEYCIYRFLHGKKKKEMFYKYWTRKEAFIKAIGDGLTLPLESLDVSNVSDETGKISMFEVVSQNVSQWYIHDLDINSGYEAAFAKEKQCSKLMSFQWKF